MAAARSGWVLGASLLGCLAAVAVALVVSGSTQADPATAGRPAANVFEGPSQAGEVVGLRTATSRTYRRPDGRYEARFWSEPVNYRSGDQWKAIDTDLRSDGADGLKTTATPAAVELPGSLDDAAKVSGGSRWVAFRLPGADGDVAPAANGSTATYADALGDVDVAYDAVPTGVKETLTLPDASAPATYRYAIDASSGLTPALRANGTVAFRDPAGSTRFWLPAPTVQGHDAAQSTTDHVAYHLSADKQTLTVSVDEAWLAGASFPVKVDPTIYYGDDVSCTLADGTLQDTADCGGTTLKVGHDAAHTYRTALRFPDLNEAIPRTASVDSATLGLYFESQTSTDPDSGTPVTATGLAHTVAEGATWNMSDDVHGWDTPGGDTVSDPQAESQTLYPEYADGWVSWDIGRLAESWLRDPASNKGLLLKTTDETVANVISFDGHDADHGGPNIAVTYEWHPGYEPDQTYESVAFDGTSKISLNAATGNVAVDSTDISLPDSSGLDLKVRRTFNGQDLGDGSGIFGSGWTLSVNDAAFVNGRAWWNDQRTLYLNGGAIYRFDRDYAHDTATTHAYLSPANLNADLVSDSDTGEATLTYRDTGIAYTYAASWDGSSFALKKVSDPAGHHIDIAPVDGRPDKIDTITGSDGTVLTFHYGYNDKLVKITDNNATEWKYTTNIADDHNRLVGYTSPTNRTTTYSYDDTLLPDVWDKITNVHDPDGQDFSFDYGPDGDYSQPTQITQDFNNSNPDSVTDIDYTPSTSNGHSCASSAYARTVMTDDQARKTTWCYDTTGHITKTWRPWDTTAPTAAAAGGWTAAQNGYISGAGTHTVSIAATDAQSGVKRIAVEDVGHGELASATASCPPLIKLPQLCPASYAATVSIDSSTFAEGAHTVRQKMTDLADNTGTGPSQIINVDRSGPTQAANFDATYEPDTTRTLVTWNASADPALPGGVPGSGVVSYNYRYQIGSGVWTGWMNISAPWFGLTGAVTGQTLNIEVAPVDAVGNVGPTASASEVITESTLTPDSIGDVDPGETGDAPLYSEPDDLPTDPEETARAADAAPYTEMLCNLANPCGTYDGSDAASYAIKWSLDGLSDGQARVHSNDNYDYFGGNGGDCTNFASQAMKAGGMRFMRAHGRNDPSANADNGHAADDFLHGEGSWWSYFLDYNDGTTTVRDREVTESWVRAPKLYNHLIGYGLGEIVPHNGRVHVGDVVFYNLHGTDLAGLDHTQVVTRVTSRAIWVTQHSPGYTHTLKYVLNHRIDGQVGVDYQYWIVHPTHAAANITG